MVEAEVDCLLERGIAKQCRSASEVVNGRWPRRSGQLGYHLRRWEDDFLTFWASSRRSAHAFSSIRATLQVQRGESESCVRADREECKHELRREKVHSAITI